MNTCHTSVGLFKKQPQFSALLHPKYECSEDTNLLSYQNPSQKIFTPSYCCVYPSPAEAEEKRGAITVFIGVKLQLTLELKHPGRWYPASGRMQMPRYKICFLYSSLLGLHLVTVYCAKIYFLCLSLKFQSQSNVYKHYNLSVIAVVQNH